jgi:RimJ/RimL family protein N-acetyltransferase
VTQLNFLKDYTLENKFVRLTPLKRIHINSLLEISKDPEIWTYFSEKGDGLKNLTAYVDNAIKKRKEKKEYPFVVFDKINNLFVGTTRLYEYSSELKTLKLGHTWYGKKYRGTYINKNCKYELFQFAFEKLEIEKIGFGSFKDNKISVAAMKSVGCKKESDLRNMLPVIKSEGQEVAVFMSICKNDWIENVKQELKNKLTN